jgi:hypothetical protein
MALPKKEKKYLPLIPNKVGKERRQEMLDDIQEKGTFLPKGILHADLDRGMLDFVKESLKLVVDSKSVPTLDKIITTQGWAQFTETWDFKDLDENVKLPFVCTVRQPEVKYGTNPATKYNIPERLRFFYATVPTWDGQRKGADVYKIPQPIPIDVTFTVKIFCNRMRELNEFNKVVMEKFTSRQSYQQIKGHYIPIILEDITDESVKDLEKRKYYIQNYKFLMQGLLIDEEEYQVSPAISRYLTVLEVGTKKRQNKVSTKKDRPNFFDFKFNYESGTTGLTENYFYTADIKTKDLINVTSYSVFINGNYIGDDISTIQITNGDTLEITIVKTDVTIDAYIGTTIYLL